MKVHVTTMIAALMVLPGLALLMACSAVKPAMVPLDPAQATLIVPFSIDLVSIDGSSPGPAHSGKDPSVYQMAPGVHELEFIYKKTWGTGVSSELVTSDVFRATVDTAAGQQLKVGFTDDVTSIRNNSQLEFTQQFALWVSNETTGQRTDAVFARNNRGILDNIQIGNAKSVNQQAVIEPVAESGSVAVSVPANLPASDNASLEQLKRWWTNASKQERADFLIWSTSQN